MNTKLLSQTQRKLVATLIGGALLTGLMGCGGSDDPYSSTDLESAYQAIDAGMSYTTVRALVGRDALSQTADGNDATLYRWESGKGTYLFSTLLVQIHRVDGVRRKTIAGPTLSESDSFNAEE
jgi:hypothetical protein